MKSHAGLRVATLLAAITLFAPAVVRAQGDAVAIARAKVDSARYPYTAADVHFMSRMIGHHAQAIVAVRAGDAAKVRTLATAVKEVATTSR